MLQNSHWQEQFWMDWNPIFNGFISLDIFLDIFFILSLFVTWKHCFLFIYLESINPSSRLQITFFVSPAQF